jgi:hypothetical protein
MRYTSWRGRKTRGWGVRPWEGIRTISTAWTSARFRTTGASSPCPEEPALWYVHAEGGRVGVDANCLSEVVIGLQVYVVDSGVRASHSEFRNLDVGAAAAGASRVRAAVNFVSPSLNWGEYLRRGGDCYGHGTIVASLAAGGCALTSARSTQVRCEGRVVIRMRLRVATVW